MKPISVRPYTCTCRRIIWLAIRDNYKGPFQKCTNCHSGMYGMSNHFCKNCMEPEERHTGGPHSRKRSCLFQPTRYQRAGEEDFFEALERQVLAGQSQYSIEELYPE